MDAIDIASAGRSIQACVSIIIVPDRAISEPGYIQAITVRAGANDKHEFHALAQMAYFQGQDDELDVTLLEGPCQIEHDGNSEDFLDGMVIFRSQSGELGVALHTEGMRKKLLEAAYRYCTRWVRLDI